MHESITTDRVCDAIERSNTGTDNPGFCIECGHEQDGCEPDARNYECELCGAQASIRSRRNSNLNGMKAVDFPLSHVLVHKRHRGQCIRSYCVERATHTKNTIEIYSDGKLIGLVDGTEKSATIDTTPHSRLTSSHVLATRAWLNRHNYNVSIVQGDLQQT